MAHQNILKYITVILVITSIVFAVDDLTVDTNNGQVKGTYGKSLNGEKIRQFYSIPFAKPPVGELRFKPPQPAERWNGVLDGTNRPPMCPQINLILTEEFDPVNAKEDCLYLNVFTPEIKNNELLPVMVFIHGGAFYTGDSSMYAPNYLVEKGVILVTIQYRLGALGFLSTGDSVLPGNNGMKDQNMALQWVQQNIRKFGGDPTMVTIFGESAGGASTHLHMVSPMSKGLFSAVISQSGTAFAPWGLLNKERAVEISKILGSAINCPTQSSQALLDCLQKKSAEEIVGVHSKFFKFDVDPIVFYAPVIEPKHDGAFIDEKPHKLLMSGKASDVPWMTGVTTEEGIIRSGLAFGKLKHTLQEYDKNFVENARDILMIYDDERIEMKAKLIKQFYFGVDSLEGQKSKLTDLIGDVMFSYPAHKAVTIQQKQQREPIYLYQFGYRGICSLSLMVDGPENKNDISHGDDLVYLFPVICPVQKPPKDLEMVEIMTTLWTNFAKYRNPTPKSWKQSKWYPVATTNNEYFEIKSPDALEMNANMFSFRMGFWQGIDMFRTTNREEL